jgi:PAS domain S-box-containing protein
MKKALPKKSPPPASADESGRMKEQLDEALETLNAIRNGEVDAVVVRGAHGHQICSLAGAEQPYRVYVEQMQEGAVTVSSGGLVLYCNPRFADMVGLPLERTVGSSILQHIPEEAWQAVSAVFGNGGGVVKHPAPLRRQDATLPVSLAGSLFPMEGQNVMCLVVTDLSDQLRKGELERASKAKAAFLAALSHELRTPLNPVLLVASESAEDRSLPAWVRADFAMIQKNVELEARLIDDLLDLTHISSGKMPLQKKHLSLHAVLQDSVATARPEIERKQIRLTLNFGATEHGIIGDAIRLQQVFLNVLQNAVKFTAERGKILVETWSRKNDRKVAVRISDTGIGMTHSEMERVFNTFSHGDHANGGPHRFEHVGLGISKMLVELHSGRIQVSSEGRGRGSVFVIEFPLADAAPDQARTDPQKTRPTVEKGGARPGPRVRILLVEDHEPTRKALTHLLSRRNYEVEIAASIAEALEIAGKGRFDVVISDIGLPDGLGYDLMEELKSRYRLRGIALTGYGMEKDVVRSQKAGFVFHLTKPVHAQALDQALGTVLFGVP